MGVSSDQISRRAFVVGATTAAAALAMPAVGSQASAIKARPFPLSQVRLKPSPYLDATKVNRAFLMSLVPDRLLARFRENAGLTPKAAVYGGWESDTIAGHTLGHYLSALSSLHAQTGDDEAKRRVDYIVAELALCQSQSSDGYVAALGRRINGAIVTNGKSLFEEVMKGQIDPRFGNLNGGWAPLYNIHKQLAGLLAAHQLTGNAQALEVAVGVARYIDFVFSKLDATRTQTVLDCEYGGLQESMAELYDCTRDQRWLQLARRLRHDKTFDPVAAGRDELDKAHSNTEIPKYVASARLYEVGGGEDNAAAARFFWRTVTRYRTYVNGGNGDREWFYPKGQISKYITDQTCEHCSTYNMLKLTRHLFQWEPKASWFDYYERAHINHTLAAQNPRTGMFAYMIPLMAGARRTWSQPVDQFWCCMGTGMEAHSKHGDSIYWRGGTEDRPILYVNEYIPSELQWPGRGRFELKTTYPHSGRIVFEATDIERRAPLVVAMRLPSWSDGATLRVNGKPVRPRSADGYILITHTFETGDTLELVLPLTLRAEATPDDPDMRAYLYGPMVLAADMGKEGDPLMPEDVPAVIAQGDAIPLEGTAQEGVFRLTSTSGEPLILRPFYNQHDNRTAVYFPVFSQDAWRVESEVRARVRAERQAIAAASLDIFQPGDLESETAHGFAGERTELTPYRGRKGRLIKAGGGFIEADLKVVDDSLKLCVTYWGEAERGMLDISLNGTLIATQKLANEKAGDFFEAAYPIPAELIQGKDSVRLRLQPRPDTRGPSIYGVRIAPVSAAADPGSLWRRAEEVGLHGDLRLP